MLMIGIAGIMLVVLCMQFSDACGRGCVEAW